MVILSKYIINLKSIINLILQFTFKQTCTHRREGIRFQNFTIISKCCAELIGTGMLVFFGCMGLLIWDGVANHMAMVLNFGFVIMIIIQLFAHVSGAHFNPCLTLSATILKTLPIKVIICFIVLFTKLK